jgi:AbiV family abortive infection protein
MVMSKKKRPPKTKKIPLNKIQEGITLSLKKAVMHLDAAESLIDTKHLDDSAVLMEFAIEEFGRAVILREMLKKSITEIEKNIWYNHDPKYEAAFRFLDKELQTVWEGIDPQFTISRRHHHLSSLDLPNGPDAQFAKHKVPFRIIKETLTPNTRLNAIFVDFKDETQVWSTGIMTSQKNLERMISEIREKIATFTIPLN